ncbi:MAG TPA: hypothetical protein PKJ08_11740, partial [Candidatus Cloacimonadota bacterium]|nr:hypothetical protein [Candidatus Cloacimonadota bacterium]
LDTKKYLQKQWFVNSNLSFLSNTSQSLRACFTPSFGAGNYLIRNNKLFEPYTSEKSIEINTGMGLSLVKKACELIRLDISFEVKDKSTTFTIKESKE